MSKFPGNPYESPSTTPYPGTPFKVPINPNPQVQIWHLVYVGFVLFCCVLVIIGSVLAFIFAEEIAQADMEMQPEELQIMGVVYAVFGILGAILHMVGLVWRKGMGGWVYNLILIVLGVLCSCCTWPAAIPLMIFWIKDKDSIIYS